MRQGKTLNDDHPQLQQCLVVMEHAMKHRLKSKRVPCCLCLMLSLSSPPPPPPPPLPLPLLPPPTSLSLPPPSPPQLNALC